MNINDDIIGRATVAYVNNTMCESLTSCRRYFIRFFVCRHSLYSCCCVAVVARGGALLRRHCWLIWMHAYLLVNIIASMWHVQCERNKICCFVQIIRISNLFSRLFNFTFAVCDGWEPKSRLQMPKPISRSRCNGALSLRIFAKMANELIQSKAQDISRWQPIKTPSVTRIG